MGRGYRKQGNFVGWMAFFAIGGAIFAGLLFALMYFKKHADAQERKAAKAMPQTNHPTLGREASAVVREILMKDYKSKGEGLGTFRVGDPKEVLSKKFNRKVVILEVQHGPAGSEKEPADDVFVLDRQKITKVKKEDWEKEKVGLGIDEEP